ncbi:hypothetical protein L5515_014140 [Caenorhabditis briggsae]|uniref:Uncharacterized protein n=2 Tax=Caenorhabditis briggsae TaxID=6238 RepID=A0AAE9E8C9_CAEBR|nr:hypothetical protein L5515_014140 [Caenorhabditis briggsae]
MSAEHSATHSIFHWKTAQLIARFLHQNKLKPAVVESETLKTLCKHLNVLMEMPTTDMIESANFAAGYEPEDDDLSSTCIWCGLEVSKPLSFLLSEKNAAIILTAAVIDNQKTLKQAKKSILNDKLYLCESHIIPMREAMIDVLGGESNRERRVPAYSFLVGLVFFNKLMKIRKVYVEEEFTEMAEGEYRKLVANLLTKDIPRVPAKEPRNHQRSVKRKDNTVTVSQAAPTATATAIVSELLGGITQTVEDGDIPDLKKVKLEEEEYNEMEATNPSTSSSLAPTFQQPIQKPPPTLLPSNMRIYTLKNGKKVVKAPVILKSAQAALAKTSGKLVTVRVARRRVIRSAAKKTESEVEKKPENLI